MNGGSLRETVVLLRTTWSVLHSRGYYTRIWMVILGLGATRKTSANRLPVATVHGIQLLETTILGVGKPTVLGRHALFLGGTVHRTSAGGNAYSSAPFYRRYLLRNNRRALRTAPAAGDPPPRSTPLGKPRIQNVVPSLATIRASTARYTGANGCPCIAVRVVQAFSQAIFLRGPCFLLTRGV